MGQDAAINIRVGAMTEWGAVAVGGVIALASSLVTLIVQGYLQRTMAREERVWSRRAETYVSLLHHQAGPMFHTGDLSLEVYRGTAPEQRALRDELTAKAAAFASDTVRDRWQASARASFELGWYLTENGIFVVVGDRAAVDPSAENDDEYQRLYQAWTEAQQGLARQVRSELRIYGARSRWWRVRRAVR